MKTMLATTSSVLSAVAITLISGPGQIAYGQDDDVMEEVVVTGSRIRRNLGAKRTLVLVDGRRWIAGASASGVPGTKVTPPPIIPVMPMPKL